MANDPQAASNPADAADDAPAASATNAAPTSTVNPAPSAAANDPPTSAASDGIVPDHPILAVDGRWVRGADVVAAKLADADNAFSESTRAALARAASAPINTTSTGQPVIGVESLMRAFLTYGADRIDPTTVPSSESEAVVKIILAMESFDPVARTRLTSLIKASAQPTAIEEVVVDPTLTHVLAEAARLVRRLTPNQTRIDLRHALLATLASASAQRVFYEALNWGPTADPPAFFSALFKSLGEQLGPSGADGIAISAGASTDSPQALSEIIAGLAFDPAAAPIRPLSRSEVRFVGDAPAQALADDRLGVADEARALAEVICLLEPGPPLAIGLFGDWGSGKSTFMNMMEAAINELTAKARDDVEARRVLVSNVVHIKFNAWHYNDANLWASLTSEFFSQLRAGGHGSAPHLNYEALVRDVAQRIATVEGEAAAHGADAVQARKRTESLQVDLETLEARRRTESANILTASVFRMVSGAKTPEELEKVRNALDLIGVASPSSGDQAAVQKAVVSGVDRIRTEVDRAVALPGRIAAFGRALLRALIGRDPSAALLLYLALVLATVVVVGLREFQLAGVRGAFGALAAIGAMVVSGAAGLVRVYRVVEPIFRAADESATQLRKSREVLDTDIAEKRRQLAAAKKQISDAEALRVEKEAEASRFRGGTPEQVFDYFLNVSEQTRRFEGELGTVSRVRRAFEQLDAIFVERKRLRDDPSTKQTTDGAAAKLSKLDRVTGGIDRIVLYIDDLDRCQVQQVVKVLVAVHLLLAFPLFVVVVGVDARWLEESLLDFYRRQLRNGTREGSRGDDLSDHRATVHDYLEKIFQIPIRLRRLGGHDDPRFKDYLSTVAGPIDSSETPPSYNGGRDEKHTEDARGGAGATAVPAIDVQLESSPESARETVKRITLRRKELEMVVALSDFLTKSARGVKRFMNIYRLVRGLQGGSALDAFLDGSPDGPATFPTLQFWLAADLGLTPELETHLHAAINACSMVGVAIDELADALIDKPAFDALTSHDKFPRSGVTALKQLRRQLDASTLAGFARALKAVGARLPGAAGTAALVAAHAEMNRFSLRQS